MKIANKNPNFIKFPGLDILKTGVIILNGVLIK